MLQLGEYFRDFSHLIFPFNCLGCGNALDEGELPICDHCREHLPLTHYWRFEENSVEKLFWGKLKIDHACAFTFFTQGGIVQKLIHQLKYKGKTESGELMGQFFGDVLKETDYANIDMIIPVPLHKDKFKKRGYNQCEFIASGISEKLNKPVITESIARVRANETQTKKGLYERWINVKELFRVEQPELIEGKHVLLVDDVITTGATLEACAGAVLQVPGTRVSLAALACPSPV